MKERKKDRKKEKKKKERKKKIEGKKERKKWRKKERLMCPFSRDQREKSEEQRDGPDERERGEHRQVQEHAEGGGRRRDHVSSQPLLPRHQGTRLDIVLSVFGCWGQILSLWPGDIVDNAM